MPRAENGMKVCSNPDCIHSGVPQPVSNFRREVRNPDGFAYRCKDCCKQRYRNKHEYICSYRRENRLKNIQKIHRQKKIYYQKNCEKIKEKSRQQRNSLAKFKTYFLKLNKYEEVRQDPENPELLQVRCYNLKCHEWFNPTVTTVQEKLKAINKKIGVSSNFYCSESCKASCPVYGGHKVNRDSNVCTHNDNLQAELREIVLEADDYTCQMCNKSKEDYPDLVLHCHHIIPMAEDLIFSADIDNCITLCEECHKKIHNIPECTLPDLRKKAQQQRENIKELIKNKTS